MNVKVDGVVHGSIDQWPACLVLPAGDFDPSPDEVTGSLVTDDVSCMSCLAGFGTARRMRSLPGPGNVVLYALSSSYKGFMHVVVSAVDVSSVGPETYIFGALEDGEMDIPVLNHAVAYMYALPGSLCGSLSHAVALARAGYRIVDGPEVVG
jgi:hypothetical protein